jgi:hypothetical protein
MLAIREEFPDEGARFIVLFLAGTDDVESGERHPF